MALLRTVTQSMGVNFLSVVEHWCDEFEPLINWKKQQDRDLELSLPALLAPS